MILTSRCDAAVWQAGFLSLLPAIITYARIRFRRLRPERRDDAIQEVIAAACVTYRIAALRGKLNALRTGPLADFAVRHVRTGRHVGGRQEAAKDVMSSVCRKRHGVGVISLTEMQSTHGTNGWRYMAVEDRKTHIPDLAAFKLDFAAWLKSLARRDRQIIGAFVGGDGTSTVADRFSISRGRVSQLRRKYEHSWNVFQGEACAA